MAIIKRGDWVLFLSNHEDVDMTLSHTNEISCRGGKICTFSSPEDSLSLNSDQIISLPPSNPYFAPIVGVVGAQQLAYYVSQEKGVDPDHPRKKH